MTSLNTVTVLQPQRLIGTSTHSLSGVKPWSKMGQVS